MILNHINYSMPIYKDCTLFEILITGSVIFLIQVFILSLITKLIFNLAIIGVGLTFASFFHVTKVGLHFLQKVKHGKPYGYYLHLFYRYAMRLNLMKPHFLTRVGKYSIDKKGC